MRRRWLIAGLLACLWLGASRPVHAQGLDIAAGLWEDFGPSLSPSLVLGARPGAVKPGFQLRFGTLSGLPVQIECGVLVVPKLLDEKTSVQGSLGLRLLPFGWSHDMQRHWGGGEGNNVGVLIGYSTTGPYAGFTYEMMATENFGFVMELVTPFGGNPSGLPRMVTLNLGAKFQLPAFGPVDVHEDEPPPAGVTIETPPPAPKTDTKPPASTEPSAATPDPATPPMGSTPTEQRRLDSEKELDSAAPTPEEDQNTDEMTPPADSPKESEDELDELAPMPVPESLEGPTSGDTPEERQDDAEDELEAAETDPMAPVEAPPPKVNEEAPREAPPPTPMAP